MTRLEMLRDLYDIFEDCSVLTNDENWDKYDTDPDQVTDHRCIMRRLEQMIRDEESKEEKKA